MINGTPPAIGRQVYDMTIGYGKIVSVEPDMSFTVDFGANRRHRFSTGGYIGNVRRIYWENPVVVEPIADDTAWQTFVNVSREMYDMVRALQRN